MEYEDRRWWATKSEGEIHSRLWSAWQDLRARDSYRQTQILHWIRLYGNKAFQALNPAAYTRANVENRLKYNVVKAVVNRIHSRIAQQRPRPLPVSTGGNYSLKRRARLLGRYLDAQFRITRAHQHGSRMVKDALVTSAGALKVYEDGEQVRIERAPSWELFVDPLEAFYGTPRTLYQQRWMPRDVVAALFSKAKKTIEGAGREPGAPSTELFGAADLLRDTRADQILVVEAWHLPSGPKAGDGRRTIAVDTGVVHSDEWEHDYFPFVMLLWDEPFFGFWSDSIPDELSGLQVEINSYLQKIQSAHHLFGHPFIFGENATRSGKNTFTNKIGTWVDTTGPESFKVQVFQTLSPEIYQQADALYNKAFELEGVTQTGGTQIPAGLPESGVGLRTFSDMQAVMHLPFAQRYELCYVDLGQQMIDRARDLSKRNKSYTVPAARDKYTLASVKWSEVDMERDQYFLQVFPTSSLPAEPSGKLAHVETMARAQLVDPRTARLLLDFPDLESETVLDRAVTEAIDRAVERMLDDGESVQPSPYMDLQLTLKRGQAHLLAAENDGVPDDRLELLRAYLDGVHVMLQAREVEQMKVSMAAAANQQPAPPAAGAPPAPGPAGQPPTAIT